MDFLVNELSVEGQFNDVRAFHAAVDRLMQLRQLIIRRGASLYCHRRLASVRVSANMQMQQAVQTLPESRRRAFTSWLGQHGPYWEDSRIHDSDTWLEARGSIVTDRALGEAAICLLRGVRRDVVSCSPSDWEFTPVEVRVVSEKPADAREVGVSNHWQQQTIDACLDHAEPAVESWAALEGNARARCERLTFASNAFEPLHGLPFSTAAADQLLTRFKTLNKFSQCFDSYGARNAEGNRLYNEHFTGQNGWFSDSSDDEKSHFRSELTFRSPGESGKWLFCTWHGKIKPMQLRFHFSWPIRADEPVYVVYVGQKITKW